MPFEHDIVDLQQIMIQPFSGWREPAIITPAMRAFDAIPELKEEEILAHMHRKHQLMLQEANETSPFEPAQSVSMPVPRNNNDLEELIQLRKTLQEEGHSVGSYEQAVQKFKWLEDEPI